MSDFNFRMLLTMHSITEIALPQYTHYGMWVYFKHPVPATAVTFLNIIFQAPAKLVNTAKARRKAVSYWLQTATPAANSSAGLTRNTILGALNAKPKSLRYTRERLLRDLSYSVPVTCVHQRLFSQPRTPYTHNVGER